MCRPRWLQSTAAQVVLSESVSQRTSLRELLPENVSGFDEKNKNPANGAQIKLNWLPEISNIRLNILVVFKPLSLTIALSSVVAQCYQFSIAFRKFPLKVRFFHSRKSSENKGEEAFLATNLPVYFSKLCEVIIELSDRVRMETRKRVNHSRTAYFNPATLKSRSKTQSP